MGTYRAGYINLTNCSESTNFVIYTRLKCGLMEGRREHA